MSTVPTCPKCGKTYMNDTRVGGGTNYVPVCDCRKDEWRDDRIGWKPR